MIMQKKAMAAKVYQLRISMLHIRPGIWRRVLVAGESTLHDLHGVIQVVMPWSNGHLHAFILDGKWYSKPESEPAFPGERETLDEAGFSLDSLLGSKVKSFQYLYDFGDDWVHQVDVEEVRSPTAGEILPCCLDGQNAAPLEDCGGPPGYQNLIQVLADPKHREHNSMKEWLYEVFDRDNLDPEHFDLHVTNEELGAGFWKGFSTLSDD